MNPLDKIRMVLVSPLYGGNVGSVCRAMMNMGLSRLYLVDPREDLDTEELRKMALQAISLYDGRVQVATLEEAVADCGLVAATTARMGLYRAHATTPREWAPDMMQQAKDNEIAVVFGPEDKGLNNEHLALCTQVIQIPSTEAYTSLNLSQAVMVVAYELYVASGLFEPVEEKSPEAPAELRKRMFDAWRETLLAVGFMKEDKADHMMMGLRRILSRGQLTTDDVKILMGMARQSKWCADELEKTKTTTNKSASAHGLRRDRHE